MEAYECRCITKLPNSELALHRRGAGSARRRTAREYLIIKESARVGSTRAMRREALSGEIAIVFACTVGSAQSCQEQLLALSLWRTPPQNVYIRGVRNTSANGQPTEVFITPNYIIQFFQVCRISVFKTPIFESEVLYTPHIGVNPSHSGGSCRSRFLQCAHCAWPGVGRVLMVWQ